MISYRPAISANLLTAVRILLVSLMFCSSVCGQIVLDADFDHGSLDEASSSVVGTQVFLAGRDNYNPGEWKWLYFSAEDVENQQLTFQIGDNFNTGGSSLEGHAIVYSYDQQNWTFFDNNVRNAGADSFTFWNDQPFSANRVWVAYGLPYSAGRVATHTASLLTSPWVMSTPSGNSNLVIGHSPGGVDDLGRGIAPQEMFGYKITDPSVPSSQVKIALVGGVHANETLGNYVLEGLVDFLVSEELEAAILRRHAEIFVYPMANPDGRLAGYNRSTVQHEDRDPNRYWVPPNYQGLDDIEVVGDALQLDTAADVDYFIDLHSTVNGKDGHFGYILPSMQDDPFWQHFLQLEPETNTGTATLITDTGAKFAYEWLDAEFTITFETQFLAGENIDRFHEMGKNVAVALTRALHVFGDLNFDGALDKADWLQFRAASEADLSGLSAIETYAAGDLNSDGRNSVEDFGLFKAAYLAVHGPEAFNVLLATVPEPQSITITLTFMTFLPARRRSLVSPLMT